MQFPPAIYLYVTIIVMPVIFHYHFLNIYSSFVELRVRNSGKVKDTTLIPLSMGSVSNRPLGA